MYIFSTDYTFEPCLHLKQAMSLRLYKTRFSIEFHTWDKRKKNVDGEQNENSVLKAHIHLQMETFPPGELNLFHEALTE